jgi:hypothetical protein
MALLTKIVQEDSPKALGFGGQKRKSNPQPPAQTGILLPEDLMVSNNSNQIETGGCSLSCMNDNYGRTPPIIRSWPIACN